MDGYQIAKDYEKGELCGWAEARYPGIAKQQFDLLKGSFIPFPKALITAEKKKVFLHWYLQKGLGFKGTFVPDYYPQEIGDPFVAGTKVLMEDGSEKSIEDVKIGDKVVNHKNEVANVTNVIKKKFTGNLITIKVKGWHRELTATESHHGMILPYTQYRFQYSGEERRKFGEMQKGDYVLLPFGQEKNDAVVIDLANHAEWEKVDEKYCYAITQTSEKKVNRYIAVNEDFARFAGLYLAEGGSCGGEGGDNGISFSLNVDEVFYMNELLALGKDILGLDGAIHRTGVESCRRVTFGCRHLYGAFSSLFGDHTHNKLVPSFFYNTSRQVKLALLRGWLDGDGQKLFELNTVIGYTTSPQLGDDMSRLSLACGLNVSTWTAMKKKRAKVPCTQVGLYSEQSYQVYPEESEGRKIKRIRCNNTPYGYARKISKVSRRAVVDHDVYCITTENEWSAVFNGIASYQCVSFGAKHTTEVTSGVEIFLNGEREQWRPIFAPFYYGTGRVYVGGGRLGNGDGSLGSWMAEAVMKYGTLFADEQGVPKYSGSVAKRFGDTNSRDDLDKFKDIAVQYPVKSAALIRSWDEFATAIYNGYAIATASNLGYNMEASSDGFHKQTTDWAHQMFLYGVDETYKNGEEPYALMGNSWGDSHGRLKDFETGEELPMGTLRIRRKDVEKHIRAGETYAYSNFQGMPARKLPKEAFMLI